MKNQLKLYVLKGLFLLALALMLLTVSVMFQELPDETSMDAEYDYEEVQLQITVASGVKPPEYDADALRLINADFRGWLQIPDTEINLPVVQGTNNSYYLKHSFSRARSGFGCLFLDYRTTASDRSLVIHGHNMGMNRNEMFSSLVNYQDQTFAQAHSTLFYSDPDKPGEERYTLFAVRNLDIRNKDPFNYRQQQFQDDSEFQAFVSFLKEGSIYQSDYTPSGEIIILSTCNDVYGEHNRLLICAGRDKESTE